MEADLLRDYLNQTVTLRRATGGRTFEGEIRYEDPVDLKARYAEKQQAVTNPQGQEVTSTAAVLTEEELRLGDLVNGRAVQSRESIVDFDGTVLGWRSYL
ncbi:MAG: hypothetical protein M3R38_01860 [Actinomycetota bacterium]|nr:hypothetical protein [Actinomycetota bacterium]